MESAWLGRFRDPLPIRCRGAFHFYSARTERGEPRVVVVGGRGTDAARVDACLTEVERVHALIAGGCIPAVAERGTAGPTAFLAFDCDAVIDFDSFVTRLGDTGARTPYATGIGFVESLMTTLERVHGVVDPVHARPICLGRLCTGGMLLGATGHHWLIGFGHCLPCLDEHGGLLTSAGVFVATEVAAGALATPGADVLAVTLWVRSMIAFTELPAVAVRVLQGRPEAADLPILAAFQWANERILGAPPDRRPSVAEALAKQYETWQAMQVSPDLSGHRRFVARTLASFDDTEVDGQVGPSVELVVGADGEWVQALDGTRYRLGARKALRRIVVALAQHRLASPGECLDQHAILEAGWPGEQPLPEAGANRVYVAVSMLRKMGLGDVLQRQGDGYRLDPTAAVRLLPRVAASARVG